MKIAEVMGQFKMPCFFKEYDEVVIIAPTGAGKTTLLLDHFKHNDGVILYLSPLRALADECFERLEKEFGKKLIKRLNDREKLEKFLIDLKDNKKRFGVATVENIPEGYLEEMRNNGRVLIVFDEIHLFFHWGENFRPVLLERYYEARINELKILSLTATLSAENLSMYQTFSSLLGASTILIDLGNYGLKRNPKMIHYFHHNQKKYLYKEFWRKLERKEKKETILVFVAFRNEVDELVDRLTRMGYLAIGCVSGEVEKFKQAIVKQKDSNQSFDVIVATTCLSHGVNLPALCAVFLFYPIQHRDFWVQMVGRAGRRGEEFEVFEMNGFDESGQLRPSRDLKVRELKNSFKNYFLDLWG